MKKILIGAMVILSLAVVGCSKSYTEDEVEAIQGEYEKFNDFVDDFRANNIAGYPEVLEVLLTEIEENEGIVDKSILENTTKKVSNIKDDLNNYDLDKIKDCMTFVAKQEKYDEQELDGILNQLDLTYTTMSEILAKYLEIIELGNDERYNTAEIEQAMEIVADINKGVLNTWDEETRESFKESMDGLYD